MHGLFVSVSVDPAGSEDALKDLTSRVVPTVKQSPGFVAAYWFAPREAGGKLEGYAVLVYDSEANAKQSEQMAKNAPQPDAVTFTNFDIREIIASA